MGVFQRTATTLVNKAGKTLVDLVLNASSNNPIANSAVTAEINQINNDLSELTEKAERGDFGMPALDTNNPLHVLASTRPTGDTSLTYGMTYTATQDCFIVGFLPLNTNVNTGATLKVNGLPIVSSVGFHYGGTNAWGTNYDGSLQGFRISAGDVVTVDLTSPDMHIVKAKTS